MSIRRIRNIIALLIALIIVGVCLTWWKLSRSATVGWNNADQIARAYAIEHHLVHVPIRNTSTQFHVRRSGLVWRPYYFVEFQATYGQSPLILEITVDGRNGEVVATDLSQRLKSRYPITGFNNR